MIASAPRAIRGAEESATQFCGDLAEVSVAELDLAPARVGELARWLSPDEAQRAARFLRERDRRRFTVARARLRELLAERLEMRPDAIEFAYGTHGKPELARPLAGSGLRFNVSHAEGLAVFAFTRHGDVGVDVEAVDALRDADDIARRFFSPRETASYLALHPGDRPLGFFNCWTRKEAFIKAIGEGLSHPLDRFDVTLAPGDAARILRVGDVPGERCGWVMSSFRPRPGFVAALVTGEAAA